MLNNKNNQIQQLNLENLHQQAMIDDLKQEFFNVS